MMVQLVYLGRLSDVSGQMTEDCELPDHVGDTSGLRVWLDRRFRSDGAFTHATVRIALDGEIVADPYPLRGAREIALMPPVGGG